jgi:hypothetical protein
MKLIGEFVTVRGGGIVFLAGPRFNPTTYRGTPLEQLFPVDLSSVRTPSPSDVLDISYPVTTTPLGRASPHLQIGATLAESDEVWKSLPELYWFLSAGEIKPGARVLVEQLRAPEAARDALPVVVMQFAGAGKVILHTTDETYRWAQHRGDDRFYSRYWLQLIHYLSRSKLTWDAEPAVILTDRDRYRYGDVVRIRVQLSGEVFARAVGAGVRVMVESDQGQRREIELVGDAMEQQVFTGIVDDLAPGRHRVWLVAPQYESQPEARQFEVQPPESEHSRLQMQAGELRRAAEVSRGEFYRFDEAHRLPDDLPLGRRVRVETLPAQPIWNSSWLVAVLVSLLTAEWLLRRRAGMV